MKIGARVPVTDHVIHYALVLVRQTRVGETGVPDFVRDWLSWGAGAARRAVPDSAAKARALLNGRTHVQCEDIRLPPTLRHRILTNFSAAS